MQNQNPNLLVVEGKDDNYSVRGIVSAHVMWQDSNPPVHIETADGVEKILGKQYLEVRLQSRPIRRLGVMLDADENITGRYQSLRHLCSVLFPAMPPRLPAAGLIVENPEGKKLGIWIMPDNVSPGSLETFLKHLVPDQQQPVWKHAQTSVGTARSLGAACRDCHVEKAHLATWLAWQDPPGRPPGLALTNRILDPHAPTAVPFVAWFRALYGL